MRYDNLNLRDIMDEMAHLMNDYATHHLEDDDVKTECMEKFFDRWHNVSFQGMTKQEADQFVDVLGSVYDINLKQMLVEEKEEGVSNEN